MMKKYYESDADLSVLKGKKIAVIGYGSQGRGQSLNLRDSGLDVIIGLRKGKSWDAAAKDGMTVLSVAEAAKKADIIQILLPDELQAAVYKNEIMPHLTENKVLMFSHGFNIHFGQIQPPANIDVIMVAPKGPGFMVRRQVRRGQGRTRTYRHPAGPHGKSPEDCACIRQRDRGDACRRPGNHVPRGDRDRSLR